jgi:hypothetical protein
MEGEDPQSAAGTLVGNVEPTMRQARRCGGPTPRTNAGDGERRACRLAVGAAGGRQRVR